MGPSHTKQRGLLDSIMFLAAIGLIAAVAGLAYNLWHMSVAAKWDDQYRDAASELRLSTQQINVRTREAFSGRESAFSSLAQTQSDLPEGLSVLHAGSVGLPAPGPSMNIYLARLDADWSRIDGGINSILAAKDRILFTRQISAELNANIKSIQAHFADLVDIMSDLNVSKSSLLAAQQQLWLIERIGRNIDRILAGGNTAQAAAEEFKQDALLFERNMEGMRDGDGLRDISKLVDADAIETLQLASSLYSRVSSSVEEIYTAYPEIIEAAKAAELVADATPALSAAAGDALVHVDQLAADRQFTTTTATYFGAVALLLLVLMLVRHNGTRSQERQAQAQAEANEAHVWLPRVGSHAG